MWKIAGLSLTLLVFGCGDTSGGTPDMAMPPVVLHNFDDINSQVFQKSCANFSVCHGSKVATQGNLDLKTDPYAALVGVTSDNAKAKGQGLLRVKPCDSANSFLITKLTLPMNTDPQTDYGHYMPDTNPHLPMEQIQAIKDWIDRGALKSEPATVSGNKCTLTAGDMAVHD